MAKSNTPYLVVEGLAKHYGDGEARVQVLDGITTTVNRGEICVMLGPSGSGKSTFLNLIGGLEGADGGSISVGGIELTALPSKDLGEYRRRELGFVFQFYNLVQNLTALENVELASQICTDPLDAAEVLAEVGLSHRIDNFPSQLSGGEQQRVAIARALAKNPKVLLADEPTGALDYKTGKAILKLLQDTCANTGKTVVLITHNSAFTDIADRVIHIREGKVAAVEQNAHPASAETIEW